MSCNYITTAEIPQYIVRTKLKALGIKESSISWFASYLGNRVQRTCVDGILSDSLHTGSGVPQGSILGPLLFLCYINDMPKYCNNLRPFIYADDTALLASGNNIETIQNSMQADFDRLLKWFHANKLSIDAKKTKVCVYSSRRSQLNNDPIKIVLKMRSWMKWTR